jgi:hypothetical protein
LITSCFTNSLQPHDAKADEGRDHGERRSGVGAAVIWRM